MAIPSDPVGCCCSGRSRLGEGARGAVDRGSPGLHHRAPVGLLVIGGPDHEDLALEPEQRAGEGQRGAPLAGAGLGAEALDARAGVLVGLGHGGVRLVRAGGRDPLVLVIDVGGGIELPLQAPCAVQRGGPPQPIGGEHLLRDRHLGLGGDLLFDQAHREDRGKVGWARRLHRLGVERRERVSREVDEQVDPLPRQLALAQQELDRRLAHRWLLSELARGEPTLAPPVPPRARAPGSGCRRNWPGGQ